MFMNPINLEFTLSAKLKTQNIESQNKSRYDSGEDFSRGEVMNLEVKTARIPEKVIVIMEGETIAETTQAVVLMEKGYDPVYYIPKMILKKLTSSNAVIMNRPKVMPNFIQSDMVPVISRTLPGLMMNPTSIFRN